MVPSDHLWGQARRTVAGAITVFITLTASDACRPPDDPLLARRFAAACAELAEAATRRGAGAVAGLDGWYFSAAELRTVGAAARAGPGVRGDAVSSVLAVKRQLDDADVELLLVPVPPKSIIYPDRVAADLGVPIPVPRLDSALEAVYARLRDRGVNVLDLTDRFIRDRFHPEGPLYCRQDSRWSGTGCVVAAHAIAEVVTQRPWADLLESPPVEPRWYVTTIRGDLGRRPDAAPPAPEELRLRGIVRATERGAAPVEPDAASPVALMGDSHTLIFHAGGAYHARGAGLADQLAFALGAPVALASADAAASAESNPLALDRRALPPLNGKRLVIWCFAARWLLARP